MSQLQVKEFRAQIMIAGSSGRISTVSARDHDMKQHGARVPPSWQWVAGGAGGGALSGA
jgi:hypothetical protein